MNDKLSEILNIRPVQNPDAATALAKDTDEWEYARASIMDAIAKGNDAMNELLAISKASNHPAAYEVFTALLKEVVAGSKTLLDAKRVKQQIDQETDGGGTRTINNNMFVGSTAELAKILETKRGTAQENP